MSPGLRTVLEIAGIGSTLLFLALGGLIALMYLLTSPVLYGGWPRLWRRRRDGAAAAEGAAGGADTDAAGTTATDAAAAAREQAAAAEQDRRRRAVGLAVAAAVARAARPAAASDAAGAWRRLHRTRRFAQPTARARART